MSDHKEPINNTINPWLPEQDLIKLAILGKLIEECNELSARAARCIIHGINENDPDTKRTNKEELEREIADVIACIMTLEYAGMGSQPVQRTLAKAAGFQRWHDMIRGACA